jgi:hypothetical protein
MNRRILAVLVVIAVGALLMHQAVRYLHEGLLSTTQEPGAAPAPWPLLPAILIVGRNCLASAFAGVLAVLLAPTRRRRRVSVEVVAAIVFVLTVRFAFGPGITTTLRLQHLLFAAASLAGCHLAGAWCASYLDRRAARPT